MAEREIRRLALLGEEALSPFSDSPANLCIQALADKGTQAALEQLAFYATHPDDLVRTDHLVRIALWKAWKRFDPQIYAARILGHVRKVKVIASSDRLLLRNLSYLPNLEELIISNGHLLRTLSFLSTFPQLTTLRVGNLVHIHDLSVSKTLTNLTTLEILYAPQVMDFSWIRSLKKLTWLRLRAGRKVSVEFDGLEELKRRGYIVCTNPERAVQELEKWELV
jgi:hypothetical protein